LEKGSAVKARQLIVAASYGPDALKVLFKAFDDAWEVIAPTITARADAIEATRLKLANVILGLARDGNSDPEKIKNAALHIMGFDAEDKPSTSLPDAPRTCGP
jgi:hypothetical protein